MCYFEKQRSFFVCPCWFHRFWPHFGYHTLFEDNKRVAKFKWNRARSVGEALKFIKHFEPVCEEEGALLGALLLSTSFFSSWNCTTLRYATSYEGSTTIQWWSCETSCCKEFFYSCWINLGFLTLHTDGNEVSFLLAQYLAHNQLRMYKEK